ncbi:MAG: hypothetical protein ACE5HE_00005, partial [Phycisphaerae bacterium]
MGCNGSELAVSSKVTALAFAPEIARCVSSYHSASKCDAASQTPDSVSTLKPQIASRHMRSP